MKKLAPLLGLLAILSIISGYLFSKASLIGRVGISLFYKQYHFLKIWWQGALAVFAVLLITLVIQRIIHYRGNRKTALIVHSLFLATGFAGLYFTYIDFARSISHRLLGEEFHLGAYLFWMGWIVVSLYYVLKRKTITSI